MLPVQPNTQSAALPETNNCAICLEKLVEKVETVCKHLYCKECLNQWLESHGTCPLCRKQIVEGAVSAQPPIMPDQIGEVISVRWNKPWPDGYRTQRSAIVMLPYGVGGVN